MKMMKRLHLPLIKFETPQKLISKSSDWRIYHDAIILAPGVWTDAASKVKTYFSPRELEKSAKRWRVNYLNVNHNYRDPLSRIGYVKNTYWDGEKIRGDLYILADTSAGKDIVSLIDANLVNWLSPELLSSDKWNSQKGLHEATDIEFIGCAVVIHPACPKAKIREEFADYVEYLA